MVKAVNRVTTGSSATFTSLCELEVCGLSSKLTDTADCLTMSQCLIKCHACIPSINHSLTQSIQVLIMSEKCKRSALDLETKVAIINDSEQAKNSPLSVPHETLLSKRSTQLGEIHTWPIWI